MPNTGLYFGVTRELGQILRIGRARVMDQPLAEPPGRTIAELHLRMIRSPDVPTQISFEQPQTPIVPPRPKPDRMAHEMVAAINPIAVMPWFDKLIADLGRQLRRDPFVRIENQNPLVGRLRNRPIFEVATRAVFTFDDPATKAARNVGRAVRRTRIGDEHFIRYLQRTGDARTNMFAL